MNNLPLGWTEVSKGGMATNPDPVVGGIVDLEIVSGKWFVIFNRIDLDLLDGYYNRDQAFMAFTSKIN